MGAAGFWGGHVPSQGCILGASADGCSWGPRRGFGVVVRNLLWGPGGRLEEPREAVGGPQRTCWGGWDTPLSQGAFPTPSTARAAPAQVGELSPRRGPPARQGGSRSGAKVFLGECGGEVGAEADPDEPGRPARGCCTRIPQRVGTPDRPPRVPGVGVMATIPL